MGSSKKHKEKDKDREGKRHKHKDRDKDRDRERKHRSKHRHRDRREKEAGEVASPDRSDRKRRRSLSPPLDSPPQIKIEKDAEFPGIQTQDESNEGGGGATGGGFHASLSIIETNKIRAKLGLAPLEVEDGERDGKDQEPGEIVEEKKDVHKPATNISEIKRSEKLREKMALIREKRLINQKLHKIKPIADDDEDDDAAAWVEKMRKKQIAKNEAAKRAKLLEEMDEEFGVGKIVEDEFSKRKKEEAYSAMHIGGFKVEHSKEDFKEGRSVILTLKDMDGLEEEEDVLVNVNMMDNEKAVKNIELKKKKPDYKPFEGDDFDEYGVLKQKSLLSKYDEEIDGEQKKSFRLNAHGGASTGEESYMDDIRNQLRKQAVSLDMKAPKLASEYYTPTEMEMFKKPKKKRRKLKPKSIVDELVPEEDSGRDHGTRRGIRKRVKEEEDVTQEGAVQSRMVEGDSQEIVDMDVDFPDANQAAIQFGQVSQEDDIWGQVIEDEAEKELHNVLNKARKLKQKSKGMQRVEDQVAEVVSRIKEEPETEEAAPSIAMATPSKSSNIVFNSTSEFCRTLGDIPTYGKSGLRDDEDEEMLDFEKGDQEEDMENDEEEEAGGAWNAVNLLDQEDGKSQEEDVGPVLDDEPTLLGGVAAALSLATKKGYLVTEDEKKKKGSKSNLYTVKDVIIEDKNYNDIDAKYSKHDRYRGPLMDFKEKTGYKPDVNITYNDETGRSLNQKEAFRVLSHRFHGKGSGKMKTEKRAKKLLEEEAMKKMSSTDTPLNTVARMQEKQKSLQSAYIVLSGGSKTMTAHSITK